MPNHHSTPLALSPVSAADVSAETISISAPENDAREEARLVAVRGLQLFGTPPEPAFDDLTRLAAFICQTPIALISLIDGERQWFKSALGMELREVPRELGFCHHTIRGDELLTVADATCDARFAENPLVIGDAQLRFYAGAPLCDAEGHALGSLCVMDRVPRELSQEQEEALRALSRQAMAQIEMRRHAEVSRQMAAAAEAALAQQRQAQLELKRGEERWSRLIDNSIDLIYQTDASGHFIFFNDTVTKLLQFARAELLNRHFLELVQPTGRSAARRFYNRQFARRIPDTYFEYAAVAKDGSVLWFGQNVHLVLDGERVIGFEAVARDITERRRGEETLRRAHDELEGRVRERTQELSQANKVLQGKINEHQQVENALRQSEDQFRVLIETMPEIVWTSRPDGNLDYYNQRWYSYTGLSFEQTKDWGWKPVIHPDDLQVCIERWTYSFTSGEEYNVEYRLKRHDGQYRWHLGRALPLRATGGEIVSWVGTCVDIDDQKQAEADIRRNRDELEGRVHERTLELSQANIILQAEIAERRQTEIALRESEERFRAFMNSSSAIAFMKNARGHYVYVNAPLCRRFNVRPEDWLGKTAFDLHPPEVARELAQHDQQVLAGEVPVQLLEQVPTPDGKSDYWLVYKFPLRDASGEKYLAAIAIDITDQKRAEDALRETTTLQRAILDSARYLVVATDVEGLITVFNKAAERHTGYLAAEMIGCRKPDILHERREIEARAASLSRELGAEITPDVEALLAKARRGIAEEYESVYVRKDGSRFPVQISVTELRDADGALTGMLGIAGDITARKEIETTLEHQTAELVRSNAELEQFASVASHDLQEPLRMVISYLQLLERRLHKADNLDDKAREFMGYASDGAFRMQQLIHDLLDYSRLGTRGKAFTTVDCNLQVRRALANLEVALRESGTEIEVGDLPTVAGDASQLGRLFQNLIGNAVKFRDPQAQREPRVQIGARDGGDSWTFWVKDNGIGIAPEHQERVFAVFQRLHGRTEYPGTGIGLAICRKIVERHGGRIWIESQANQGATFFWTIPQSQ